MRSILTDKTVLTTYPSPAGDIGGEASSATGRRLAYAISTAERLPDVPRFLVKGTCWRSTIVRRAGLGSGKAQRSWCTGTMRSEGCSSSRRPWASTLRACTEAASPAWCFPRRNS
eukprot:scaffold48_cov311-Pinguiococcus_pyrenoidosus.AAC.201